MIKADKRKLKLKGEPLELITQFSLLTFAMKKQLGDKHKMFFEKVLEKLISSEDVEEFHAKLFIEMIEKISSEEE